MARVAIFLFLLFAILLALRLIGFVLRSLSSRAASGRPAVEGEMVRDPVCGTWIDRRLAIAGRRGSEWLPVCSEKCRRELESA
ncbi:MAG: hypothetical protein LC796_08905 [Acidobacteria bacterium]|nr:hypothetical protein [Acidobacteriota bacterium]MCA1612116.1 hypothetical protein [Acidobacteriota bacterium]